MNSILETVKKSLGIDNSYKIFDPELIIHINSVLMILYQMGITDEPFTIMGEDETWDDMLQGVTELEMVKTYICLKVHTVFDTPTNGTVLNAINESIKELEYRLYVCADNRISQNGSVMG